MKYNELQMTKKKSSRRSGRGISAGRGKTAGRGTKGQNSRAGSGARPGFEGGQIPLHMRLPKLKGFKSIKQQPEIVFTGDLGKVKKPKIDASALQEAGLIKSKFQNIKLIYKGEVTVAKEVRLPSASSSAISALEKAGGSFIKTARVARPPKKVEPGKD